MSIFKLPYRALNRIYISTTNTHTYTDAFEIGPRRVQNMCILCTYYNELHSKFSCFFLKLFNIQFRFSCGFTRLICSLTIPWIHLKVANNDSFYGSNWYICNKAMVGQHLRKTNFHWFMPITFSNNNGLQKTADSAWDWFFVFYHLIFDICIRIRTCNMNILNRKLMNAL